ncbi:MAG: hypothetical protein ACI9O4_001489 [Chitinophagales bacterium]|jgi:hypothetical protein
MKNLLSIAFILLLLFSSCKKEAPIKYGLKSTDILTPSVNKDKPKSPAQYVAVLYVNLFQQAISTTDQVEIERLLRSIGDKRLAYELIISSYMNDPQVVLPSYTSMRANLDLFIIETYERFYVRPPSQLELEYMKNYLENQPDITPELVYFAFAISDESFFY